MTRRRTPKPGPGRDFRALGDPPAQRRLPVPVATGPAELPEHAHDAGPDAVSIRVRRRPDGSRVVVLIASVVLERAQDVAAVVRRLGLAGDVLEGHARAGDDL